jgi:hypothetical protein
VIAQSSHAARLQITTASGRPEVVDTMLVSGNFFEVLGLCPASAV